MGQTEAEIFDSSVATTIPAVDALSGYLSYTSELYAASFEMISALSRVTTNAAISDLPRAWNLELALYPTEIVQFAMRYERSEELRGGAWRGYGLGVSLQLNPRLLINVEVIRKDIQEALAIDDAVRLDSVGITAELQL